MVRLIFQINLDRVYYSRNIYGVWDLLGDVGGLFDMLKLIASPITVLFTMLFRTGLSNYLLTALFQIEKKRTENTNEDILTHIKQREPAIIKICSRIFSSKMIKL